MEPLQNLYIKCCGKYILMQQQLFQKSKNTLIFLASENIYLAVYIKAVVAITAAFPRNWYNPSRNAAQHLHKPHTNIKSKYLNIEKQISKNTITDIGVEKNNYILKTYIKGNTDIIPCETPHNICINRKYKYKYEYQMFEHWK